MNDDPQTTWTSRIAEKRHELGSLHPSRTKTSQHPPPKNLADFRTTFETLCEQYNQTRAQSSLGGFLRDFKPILAFAGAVDGAGSLSAPDSLTSLFLAFATALIEVAFRRKIPLANLEATLRPHTKSIPNFGPDLAAHFAVPAVQSPLQHIYFEYIDCYTMMLSHFATSPAPLSFDPIKTRFDTATAIIAQAKEEWALALEEANKAAERQRLQFTSVPSVPNDINGDRIDPQTTNAHFAFIRKLGHGTFGQVAEVREFTTNQLYARKLIPVRKDSRSQTVMETQIKSEVAIMQKLRHPHIASVLFYVRDQDAFSIFMLPVAEYDLLHYLEDICPRGGNEAVRQLDSWFGCLTVALAFAHHARVKHHDIKPSNILIKDGQPYLSDFGSAKDFAESESSASPADAVAGTPVYFAPEKPWGRGADVFALGCVFSEMLTVRSGKTLDAYRAFRRNDNALNALAFRENLPKVREWLGDLEGQLREPLNRVCRWTASMMTEDPGKRCESKDVKRAFRNMDETELLFCINCGF